MYRRQLSTGNQSSSRSPFKTAEFRAPNRERSRSKSPGRSNYQQSHNTTLNKSSHSVHSEHLWNILDEAEIFPPICLEILRHEERNISEFKKSIHKEKSRLNSEFETFALEINHMIEDYRLSLVAILDRSYQQYIGKYAEFKAELLDLNRLKDEIETEFYFRDTNPTHRPKDTSLNNEHTIRMMEAGRNQLKKFHIINYIAELQKEKIFPIQEKAEYLMIMSEYDNGLFQPEEFKKYVDIIRVGLRENLHRNLDEAYGYIRNPDDIVFKELGKNRETVLDGLGDAEKVNSLNGSFQAQYHNGASPSIRRFNSDIPQTNSNISNYHNHNEIPQNTLPIPNFVSNIKTEPHPSIPQINFVETSSRFLNHTQHMNQHQEAKTQTYRHPENIKIQPPMSSLSLYGVESGRMHMSTSNRYSNPSLQLLSVLSPSPQVIVSPHKVSSDLIRVSQQTPFSFKSKSLDIILCTLYIEENLIAVGSKDGSLLFYDRNGNIIKNHQNVHKSPVCTLSFVGDCEEFGNRRFLASGSDHPNPEIIVWDLFEVEVYCRLKEHRGAVTAIQCLKDGDSIISGSYDKKLCVYSLSDKKLKYTLPSNKSSIIGISLNSTGSKLISCSLENNAINVWQIVRAESQESLGRVETIFLEQVIENNTMICSMVSSVLKENLFYIGTKDGKIKIVDIQKGEAIKTISCCNEALIEMLVIEQTEGLPVILSWPCKERCFKIVDCESGKVLNVNTTGQLDFSCGVGPKVSGTRDGSGFIFCSQSEDREVYWFKINRSI